MFFLRASARKKMKQTSTELYCCDMAAYGAHRMREGFLAQRLNSILCSIYCWSCKNAQMIILWKENVYFLSLFVLQDEKTQQRLRNSSTVLTQILSPHPVQELKLSWVCFFFWLFFCLSSLFLPFSFPSGCFSLSNWRFLFLLRSCTIRSCKATYRLYLIMH